MNLVQTPICTYRFLASNRIFYKEGFIFSLSSYKNIKDTGYSLPKNLEVRKRMGIEPAPEIELKGIKGIKQILEEIKREKK